MKYKKEILFGLCMLFVHVFNVHHFFKSSDSITKRINKTIVYSLIYASYYPYTLTSFVSYLLLTKFLAHSTLKLKFRPISKFIPGSQLSSNKLTSSNTNNGIEINQKPILKFIYKLV